MQIYTFQCLAENFLSNMKRFEQCSKIKFKSKKVLQGSGKKLIKFSKSVSCQTAFFQTSNCILSNCILSNCILSNCILSNCILSNCILSNCYFRTGSCQTTSYVMVHPVAPYYDVAHPDSSII